MSEERTPVQLLIAVRPDGTVVVARPVEGSDLKAASEIHYACEALAVPIDTEFHLVDLTHILEIEDPGQFLVTGATKVEVRIHREYFLPEEEVGVRAER